MTLAEDTITDLLRQRHNIRENMENDFSVRNLTAMAKTASETTKTMSILLGAYCFYFTISGRYRHYEYHARICD